MPRKPSTSRISLAAALRAAADASALSDSELARRAGLSRSQITRFRRGDRALSLDAADALCEALGLHLVAIAGRRSPTASQLKRSIGPNLSSDGEARAKTPAAQTTTPEPPAPQKATAPDDSTADGR